MYTASCIHPCMLMASGSGAGNHRGLIQFFTVNGKAVASFNQYVGIGQGRVRLKSDIRCADGFLPRGCPAAALIPHSSPIVDSRPRRSTREQDRPAVPWSWTIEVKGLSSTKSQNSQRSAHGYGRLHGAEAFGSFSSPRTHVRGGRLWVSPGMNGDASSAYWGYPVTKMIFVLLEMARIFVVQAVYAAISISKNATSGRRPSWTAARASGNA